MQLGEHWFRVKRIDLRRAAVHKQVYHPFRLRRKVRRLWSMRLLPIRQSRQGHHPKARARARKEFPTRGDEFRIVPD